MIKFNLSKESPTIVAFDGEVLELFFIDGSKRLHVAHIKGLELKTEKAGKHLFTIKLKYDPLLLWVDDEALPKVNELIAEIQKGIASFQR